MRYTNGECAAFMRVLCLEYFSTFVFRMFITKDNATKYKIIAVLKTTTHYEYMQVKIGSDVKRPHSELQVNESDTVKNADTSLCYCRMPFYDLKFATT